MEPPSGPPPTDRRGRSPELARLRELVLAEPARPRAIATHRSAVWLTVVTVCVGAFMGQLDASIVNLAFPTLQRTFGASLGAVQWVGLAYLVVVIATIPAVGRASDMVGRKLLYTDGFVVFAAGSGLCAIAPGLGWLIAFRALQAVGAVMLQANSIAIIASTIPRHRLGRAIGLQGTAQAIGLALGPVIGGLLIGLGGWRLIFLVNVPIGIAGAIASWLMVPRSRNLSRRTGFDWVAVGLLIPGLASLLVGLSAGNQLGWTSPAVIGLLVLFAALGSVFVWWEGVAANPMIDLQMFRVRRFSVGTAAGLLSYLVLFGVLFVTPFELERGRGMSPEQAGLALTLLPAGMALLAQPAGRIMDRVGARGPTTAGMLTAAIALAVLGRSGGGLTPMLIALALVGAGLGLFTPANNASIMANAPAHRAGVASGIVNLTRGLGSALGLSLTGLVFDLTAGAGHTAPGTLAGFRDSIDLLAAVAVLAAALSALRRPRGAPAGAN